MTQQQDQIMMTQTRWGATTQHFLATPPRQKSQRFEKHFWAQKSIFL